MSVIVYTAILGGCDSLKPAPKGADRAVCFTDVKANLVDPNGWEIQWWPEDSWQLHDARREAWRIRCWYHNIFLGNPTATVWIDGSFTLTDLPKLLKDSEGHELSGLRHHKRSSCYEEAFEVVKVGQADSFDVATQMSGYRCESFNPTSLTISCVLVRQNSLKVQAFNERWDAEIKKHPGDNTQLSIDYAAWKNGLSWHHLEGTRHANTYAVHDHADHKRRRKPYR
jgi:hypothetical protein